MTGNLFSNTSHVNPAEPGGDEFDWSSDDSIVLALQPATAVYVNERGAVIIRQEGMGDAEDQCVGFGTVEAVRILIARLEREIGGAR